jgi:hypothetical protein
LVSIQIPLRKTKEKLMFEIEKGRLRFLVFYDGRNVLVKFSSMARYSSKDMLYMIRDNLSLLANYYLKHSNADYKKGALKRYFSDKGWKIILYRSAINTDELGNMRVS